MRRRRGGESGLNAWPGYVDALSTLLMVIIFVLLVFVLAQAFLSATLTSRQHVLDRLAQQLAQISEMLSLEKNKNTALGLRVASLSHTLEDEKAQAAQLTGERDAARAAGAAVTAQLTGQTKLTTDAQAKIDSLDQQLVELRRQMAAIADALDIAQKDVKDRDAKIADLGSKLNLALADKVNELKRYRSEFFGKLSQVLAHRPGIRVVGDRFVFQSEVLFPPGSAELSPEGVKQMKALAATLKDISKQIPTDLPWILRVDGHADRHPIANAQFASNWELSAGRAISVVKLLIAQGIPPEHLAATGFSVYQPLDDAGTADAFAKNRRIELRLTDR